ncbi:lipoprotein [Chromohalobacter canadensis]|uniref:LPS translocon maturation chaperone LptM n=1 Tax=Chromohalobacter canadensis TaxID=141389 RepID=UPI003908AAF8|nr:lipoprotein [Chromohalobacter canadensis]MCT8472566.1 lipoprotein [Chromohalobacter canadensis]MCT8500019.1 lipoprotein [Chromohalobacter canadensis]
MRLLPMLAALGIALFTLAGCGQKGPLYMPDDEQASEQYDPADAYEDGDQDEDGAARDASSQSDSDAD